MEKAQQLTANRNVKLLTPTSRKRSPQRLAKAITVRTERPRPLQASHLLDTSNNSVSGMGWLGTNLLSILRRPWLG